MEHLKDIVNGLLNSLPAEAAENEKNTKGRTTAKKQDMVSGVMFSFEKDVYKRQALYLHSRLRVEQRKRRNLLTTLSVSHCLQT